MKTIICDKCGATVPGDSQFCQVCGSKITIVKTNDNNKLYYVIIAVLCVAIIGMAAGLLSYSKNNKALYTACKDANATVQSLQKEKAALEKDIASLKTKNNELNDLYERAEKSSVRNYKDYIDAKTVLDFYKQNIVFVGSDGRYYHSDLWCSKFNSSTYWAYNVEAAKSQGYKKCAECSVIQ